jgi:transposase
MVVAKLDEQRKTILHFWKKNIRSARKIHTLTKIPIRTIYYNLKKFNTGNVEHKKGAGRPTVITAWMSNKIQQYIKKEPTISVRNLVIKMGKRVSRATIARHLKSLGYKYNTPTETPMLTDLHKEKRVEWAEKHLNDNWDHTFFTDETAFQLFRNTIGQWYKGSRPFRRIPKDRSKIFAWGGFSKKGTVKLYCFRGIMTAKMYVEIIEKNLSEIKGLFGKKWRFLQDNDPKHTSHLAKSFLEAEIPELMDWPSNSPDINPIENLWSIVKRKVEERMPQNSDDLMQFMVEEWSSIPKTTLINLVDSMPTRCELVIKSKGERIEY